MHVTSGLHEHFTKQITPRLELVLRGIKKDNSKGPDSKRVRLPITVTIMDKIHQIISTEPDNYNHTLFWAACNLAFFGFLRCSEFTLPSVKKYDPSAHLCLGDVALDSTKEPTLVQLSIKQSKTDPFRQGIKLFLAKTGKSMCPVQALIPFLTAQGPIAGPLFLFQNGEYLTRQKFSTMLREILARAGIDSSGYNTHSFRIGAATTAHEAGIPDIDIKMLGRWKSDAYQLYVRTSREKLATLTTRLVSK